MVLLLPPAPAARVLAGRVLATFSFWSAAARRRIWVRAPPGGGGGEDEEARLMDAPEAAPAGVGEDARGEDCRSAVSKCQGRAKHETRAQKVMDEHADAQSGTEEAKRRGSAAGREGAHRCRRSPGAAAQWTDVQPMPDQYQSSRGRCIACRCPLIVPLCVSLRLAASRWLLEARAHCSRPDDAAVERRRKTYHCSDVIGVAWRDVVEQTRLIEDEAVVM